MNPVLEQPFSSKTGDFNEDGHADVAISNELRNQAYITVLLGDGTGSFPLEAHFPVSGTSVEDIEIADFNQDGHEDICAVDMLSFSVSVLLGDGQGHFSEAGLYDTGGFSEYVTVGDFNEDHYPDVAVSLWVAGKMSVLLNDGAGGFEPPVIYDLYGGTKEIDIGDFNEDGHQDLAVATMAFNVVVILYGEGDGSFDYGDSFYVDYDAYVVRVADFNGDEHDDIAVGTKHSFLLLTGDGEGSFTRTFETRVFDPHAILAGDFNEDGLLDAVVSMTQDNCFQVYLGDGAGGFIDNVLTRPLSAAPRSLDAADFNEDGHMDLTSANEGSDDMCILMNQVDLLEITTEKTRTMYLAGDQAVFTFWISNAQDTTVNGAIWFTLKRGDNEKCIDQRYLPDQENPQPIAIPPGYDEQWEVHFIIPPNLKKGLYQFYVNVGLHDLPSENSTPPETGNGAAVPVFLDTVVWSNGKFPVRVILIDTDQHIDTLQK